MSLPRSYYRAHVNPKPPPTVSFATEMLATAQAAYKDALGAQFAQINGMRWQAQEIDKLRGEVAYWQAAVDRETAAANGTGGRGAVFRFTL